MCILLVEDEWLIRTMVAEELADCGFPVREAESGDEAAALIERDPGAFTLLVTDVHMPGRMDGIAVAQAARAIRPDLPIIYTTGRPDVLDPLQPLGPRDALLWKPFALSELVATVRRLLDQGSARVG